MEKSATSSAPDPDIINCPFYAIVDPIKVLVDGGRNALNFGFGVLLPGTYSFTWVGLVA